MKQNQIKNNNSENIKTMKTPKTPKVPKATTAPTTSTDVSTVNTKTMSIRTAKVKLQKKDAELVIPIIRWSAKCLVSLEQQLMTLSGREYHDGDGVLIWDGATKRNALCKNNASLIAACDIVYRAFVRDTYGRGFTCWLFGGKQKKVEVAEDEVIEVQSVVETDAEVQKKKELYKVNKETTHAALTLLTENKILPFNVAEFSNMDEVNSTYKYSFTGFVNEKLKSYETQIVSTKEDYDILFNTSKNREDKLVKLFGEKVIEDFKAFAAICDEHNHRINYRFLQYIRTCDHSKPYPVISTWTDKKGNKHQYGIKQEILNALGTFKSLIDSPKSILRDTESFVNPKNPNENTTVGKLLEGYLDSMFSLRTKRKVPSFTPISEKNCVIKLGNNYIPFSMSRLGEDKMQWNFTSPQKKKMSIITNHKRVGKGKHFYLEGLEITDITKGEGDKKSPSGKYTISFSINGKQPVKGELKEPCCGIRNGSVYIFLPIAIKQTKEFESRVEVRRVFSMAYPSTNIENVILDDVEAKQKTVKQSKESVDTANVAILEAIKNHGSPVKVMGVDLGLRNFAFAIKTYDGYKDVLLKKLYVESDLEEKKRYTSLANEMGKVGSYIKFAAIFYSADDTEENAKMFDAECTDVDSRKHLQWLRKAKKSGVALKDLRRDKKWIVSIKYTELRERLHALKFGRMKSYDYRNNLYWAATIKKFISLSSSFYGVGRPSRGKRDVRELKKKHTFFSTYQDLYNNVKEDYAKKVANLVVMTAKENNVDIIIVENLTGHCGSKDYKTRAENEMSIMWNHGRIKTFIDCIANANGILLAEVSEFETSQVYNETQNYGYRDKEFREILWYMNSEGNVEYAHAEVNAAINIADRFLTQHTNLFSFPVCKSKKDETLYEIDISEGKELEGQDEAKKSKKPKGGKRLKGAIAKAFGSVNVMLEGINDKNENGEVKTKTRAYNVNGKWVGKTQKDEYVNRIKTVVSEKTTDEKIEVRNSLKKYFS